MLEQKTGSENVIRFILDGSVISITQPAPSLTVLQYLREQLLRSGTKEGCAEGDCGACTVVIGELIDGRIRLRSVNACIQFVAMLHGKILFTVESLKAQRSAALHPVQQAMVDSHGSQCGFCTSGFVMSLFALFKTTVNPDRDQVNDALSGNLCRCTGYRPIIDAARKMADTLPAEPSNWLTQAAQNPPQPVDNYQQVLINLLKTIRPDTSLHLEQVGKNYYAPLTLDELAQLILDKPDATLVAGNTDVGLWVNKQLRELPDVISLALIEELKVIESTTSDITISAAVSLTDAFDALSDHYPELNELFR
ncbi:MAG: FAD binding domain-containing protein, partial [Gammaproteobacteria bacterium]|nr:FAD binding domain-containing protein [Gammaproteobacteria bacterium]